MINLYNENSNLFVFMIIIIIMVMIIVINISMLPNLSNYHWFIFAMIVLANSIEFGMESIGLYYFVFLLKRI